MIIESIDESQESTISENDNKYKNRNIEGLKTQENINIKGKSGKVKW